MEAQRTGRPNHARQAEATVEMAYLKVIGGPNEGQIQELNKPKSVMGRHSDCDVCISSPDASRHHAHVLLIRDDCFLEDLRSRNGTFLDGERIRGKQKIGDGGRIRIGDSVFEFRRGHPSHLLDGQAADETLMSTTPKGPQGEPSTLLIVSKREASPNQDTSRSHDSLLTELKALLEITRNLRRNLALHDVLPQILDTLFRVFPVADRGFIALRNEEGEVTPRWVKFWHGGSDTQARFSRTVVNYVMGSQEAILSGDAAVDSRFGQSDSVKAAPIHSIMCAPLIDDDGESFGVLEVDTASGRGHFREEDLEVLLAVASQASIAIDNARLHENVLRQRAAERDFELADQIQRSFLPKDRPHISGYDFWDYYRPASHVGGDLYNYVPLSDGRMAVVVADVAGHGLAAAMVTAKLAADIQYRLLTASRPAEAITKLNTSLTPELLEGNFVTLILAVLDPRRRELTIVNAGHMPPLLRFGDGGVREVGKELAGFPLGIEDRVDYEEFSIQIPPRGMMMIHSDGVNEAMNLADETYGVHRLRAHLEAMAGGPRDVVRTIVDDVRQFTTGCQQADDMCLVCMGSQ